MKRFVLPFLFLFPLFILMAEDVFFIPSEIELSRPVNLDFFERGATVEVGNSGSSPVSLRLIASQQELSVHPASFSLESGESILLKFEWTGEAPTEEESLYPFVILSQGGSAPSQYIISSYPSSGRSAGTLSEETRDVSLVYYYSPACRDCRYFLEKEIPRLELSLGISIGLEAVNVYEEGGMERLKNRLVKARVESDSLPVLDTGDVILSGDKMITEELENYLSGKDINKEPTDQAFPGVPLWLLVLGAGLLDGINPCAFSTLIFLLAYLGLRKGNRREILLVGIFFTITVFITYTAIGAGAFLFLRQSLEYRRISQLLRWGGGGLLLILGVLSLRDWVRVREGRAGDMTLQLSMRVKQAVHKSVRNGVRSSLPVLGACLMGFMVTLYELGCTGQIYLPTLYLMLQRGESRGMLLLLLYNGAFIMPLGVVFLLAFRGMTSDKLGRWFTEHLARVKLITALFFWVAGALIIFL
jgi:cytochrome c biogenesis protein CcdA